MPKRDRNGKAEIWTDERLDQLWLELAPRFRALFSICLYTGCRVSEARQLQAEDIIENYIVFRKQTTKAKATRQVKLHPKLRTVLAEIELPSEGYLFPGKFRGCITRQTADYALRQACDLLGFRGYSTHSFRRTALTRLSNAGTPLRVIQKISGHASLTELQKYLDVTDDQMEDAIANI
ncbi:MAG: site-specific integrase [Cyanobacteria bacterium P01_F01_bin.116]